MISTLTVVILKAVGQYRTHGALREMESFNKTYKKPSFQSIERIFMGIRKTGEKNGC